MDGSLVIQVRAAQPAPRPPPIMRTYQRTLINETRIYLFVAFMN